MKFALALVMAVISTAAHASDAESPWKLEFIYHHWAMYPFLKTPEDIKVFNAEIKPQRDNFKLTVQSDQPGVVQIKALGETVELKYTDDFHKLTLNGAELRLTAKTSFADIHSQVAKALSSKRSVGLVNFVLPEAQAFAPLIVAGIIGVDFWGTGVAGASLCVASHYPGGKAPSGIKETLFVIGGPISCGICALQHDGYRNVTCPKNLQEPITASLAKGTLRLQRDGSGKPTFVSIVSEGPDKISKEIYRARVIDEPGWTHFEPITGDLSGPMGDYLKDAVLFAPFYCAGDNGPNDINGNYFKRFAESLSSISTSLHFDSQDGAAVQK